MKRRLALVVVALLFVGVVVALVLERPRRPRPAGFDAPWATFPESLEREWALDPLKRGVVQAVFVGASEDLQHCNMEHYSRTEGDFVKFDLLFEQEPAGMQLLFARAQPKPELPPLLSPCIEQALEKAKPVLATGLAAGTRWRITVHVLLHPASDLPPPPWWHRFVPESWRSGGDSAIHIG